MTLKELREVYYISDYKHKGKFLVHTKDVMPNSRMVHKYLCSITKKGHSLTVDGFKPTTNLDVLKKNINTYVSKLPYDSEYYYPIYRKSIFVHHIIHDYLNSIGFDSTYIDLSYHGYELKRKNIYGGNSEAINLSLSGLDNEYDFKTKKDLPLSKTVTINFDLENYSWISITVKRTPKAIIRGIDTLLKPYFVGESVTNFKNADKLKNIGKTDIFLKMISGNLDLVSVDYKTELKTKLLELVEKL